MNIQQIPLPLQPHARRWADVYAFFAAVAVGFVKRHVHHRGDAGGEAAAGVAEDVALFDLLAGAYAGVAIDAFVGFHLDLFVGVIGFEGAPCAFE